MHPEPTFLPEQLTDILIQNGCIYPHMGVRINYTTYDMQCDQDYLHPESHVDLIALAVKPDPQHPHPFVYGCLLGVYHVLAKYIGPGSRTREYTRVDVLYIRWFKINYLVSGWEGSHLPCVHFVAVDDPDVDVFGFLDPAHVIHGSHLMLVFSLGLTSDLLPHLDSAACLGNNRDTLHPDLDWQAYYIGTCMTYCFFLSH